MKAAWTLAALLALGGAAEAHPKTAVVSLDGHCDVVTLQIDKGAVAGTDAASCAAGFGAGYVGKVKKFGNAIVAGVQFSQAPGEQFVLRMSYPLVTGGQWDFSVTTDGVTFQQFESGTYTVEGTADKGRRGATPVIGTLRDRR